MESEGFYSNGLNHTLLLALFTHGFPSEYLAWTTVLWFIVLVVDTYTESALFIFTVGPSRQTFFLSQDLFLFSIGNDKNRHEIPQIPAKIIYYSRQTAHGCDGYLS